MNNFSTRTNIISSWAAGKWRFCLFPARIDFIWLIEERRDQEILLSSVLRTDNSNELFKYEKTTRTAAILQTVFFENNANYFKLIFQRISECVTFSFIWFIWQSTPHVIQPVRVARATFDVRKLTFLTHTSRYCKVKEGRVVWNAPFSQVMKYQFTLCPSNL